MFLLHCPKLFCLPDIMARKPMNLKLLAITRSSTAWKPKGIFISKRRTKKWQIRVMGGGEMVAD